MQKKRDCPAQESDNLFISLCYFRLEWQIIGVIINLRDRCRLLNGLLRRSRISTRGGSTTLLAITKNGEQFKAAPWFAPGSSETTGDYLKNMVSILVNTTESKPEGIDNTLVEEPAETEAPAAAPEGAPELADKTDKVTFADFCFKVNGQDVTNADLEGLHIYKVSVFVTNKKGETSEVGYTGYKLIDVLAALGITDYTTVKAIANDGYESELTAEQAVSEYTIIAIEKDKEMGEDGTIWVAPCLETSSSAYCKLVVEIVAE
jgi:hypothetical protein